MKYVYIVESKNQFGAGWAQSRLVSGRFKTLKGAESELRRNGAIACPYRIVRVPVSGNKVVKTFKPGACRR